MAYKILLFFCEHIMWKTLFEKTIIWNLKKEMKGLHVFWDDGSLVMIIEKYSQNNIEVKNPNYF
jgi:hypothetical protein